MSAEVAAIWADAIVGCVMMICATAVAITGIRRYYSKR